MNEINKMKRNEAHMQIRKDWSEANQSKNRFTKMGLARAAALAPERRIEIAKQGALAKWGYKSTHKGNFKQDFGMDVECYILDDEKKTAMISQTGMGQAIGLGKSGSRLPEFIDREKIAPYIGHELREKLSNPVIFQGIRSGVNSPKPIVHGYDITILIDLCDAIIKADAEGKLLDRQLHIVRQAQVIRTASAKLGIKNLAWAVAGYDPKQEEIINAFKNYVVHEVEEYGREFPHELFRGWCRFYDLRETPIHPKFSFWQPKAAFRRLVLNQVYQPLGNSDGKIKELLFKARSNDEKPKGKPLFWFLSKEIGRPALRTQIGMLLMAMRTSTTKAEYEDKFYQAFKINP